MKKLLVIILLCSFMLGARNPFLWDEKIQPIECGVAVPRLESISIDPDGKSFVILKHNNKAQVCEKGERVGRWKIKAIRHSAVVLEGLDGKTCTVSLHLEDEYA